MIALVGLAPLGASLGLGAPAEHQGRVPSRAILALGAPAEAQVRVGGGRGAVAKRKVGSFAGPTYVTHAPGGPAFLYVVEQRGRVLALRDGRRLAQPFLEIQGRVSCCGERGLLSIAFDPRFRRNRLFYAYYTNRQGNIEVDEFRASSARAAPRSRRKVIVIPHPGHSNHNGGQLQFGPDGFLYIGTGDGGGAGDPNENAQNRRVLLGKLLRIDPHRRGTRAYTVPPSNPFVGRADARAEIYSLGLRNPYRFSFDAGRILIADVGQDRYEEVDMAGHQALRGANFGWDHFEGAHRFDYPGDNEAPRPSRYRPPIFEYSHRSGRCAVIGGYVVRSPSLRSLRGRYLYADNCAGGLRSFVPRQRHGRRDKGLGVHVPAPSSFGEGARGAIYVTSLAGPVYRLVAGNAAGG